MKSHPTWSYEYYLPADQRTAIRICRVAPDRNRIALEWIGGTAPWTVCYRKRTRQTVWNEIRTAEPGAVLTELTEGQDYEFFVRSGEDASRTGLARTGSVPGTVVNYLHPEDNRYAFSGRYLCTPSLLVHPDGYLLASMDVFMARQPQNLTLIFRSDDGGKTWHHLTELFPCFWGKLFLHRGEVYMLATSTEYGDLLIGKSGDGGKTFGIPTVLFRGSGNPSACGWHKSAMPVISHGGRLWTGIDYGSHWRNGHASALLSVDETADLLDAQNWTLTDLLPYCPSWEGAVKGDDRGFLEGNAVELPDGGIGEVLRYSTDKGTPSFGLIPILKADESNPLAQLSFEKFVPFPGNLSMFNILKDPATGYYVSVFSRIVDKKVPRGRNVLSLGCSTDLTDWRTVCDLLNYETEDPQQVGFQYVSFCFDGEDLIYLSRTAFNGAENFHDNNYVTFHRVRNFRKLIR